MVRRPEPPRRRRRPQELYDARQEGRHVHEQAAVFAGGAEVGRHALGGGQGRVGGRRLGLGEERGDGAAEERQRPGRQLRHDPRQLRDLLEG